MEIVYRWFIEFGKILNLLLYAVGNYLITANIANIEQITYFELSVHNQDDEFIPNFSDYILLLQFIKHTTEDNRLNSLLESLIDYVKQIYLIISQIVFPPS